MEVKELPEWVKEQLNQVNKQLEQTGFLMPAHPLTNFEIQRYYQNEARFNGIYSRNNLHKKG